MGSCFACFQNKHPKRHKTQRCIYHATNNKVDFDLLVETEDESQSHSADDLLAENVWTMSNRVPSFFNSKNKQVKKYKSERSNLHKYKSSHHSSPGGSESTLLMPLDARTLLTNRALQKRKVSWSSSTPPSSLDLEWENEGASLSTSFLHRRLPSYATEDLNSESGLGGGTSPESLEWDPIETQNVDIDTEQLIQEIEQLTNTALNETGDWKDEETS